MNKKTKTLFSIVLCGALIAGSVTAIALSKASIKGLVRATDSCEGHHAGNHYSRREAGAEIPGCEEYWVCCKCHQHFLGSAPLESQWEDQGVATEIITDPSDDRYIEPHLIYNLDFANESNRLTDASSSSKNYADTIGVGDLTYVDGPSVYVDGVQKTLKAVNVPSGAGASSYIKIPFEAMNNAEATLSYWVYMPADDVTQFRWYMDVFCNGGWRYAWQMRNTEFWQGIKPCLILNNGWDEAPAAPVDSENTNCSAPESGIMNHVMGGYVNMVYTFSSTGLKAYQNGKLALSYDGNYSMKRLYDIGGYDASGIYLGGSLWGDSNLGGRIADVRLYDVVLNEEQINNEIPGLSDFHNFLTSSYEFNGNMQDSVKTLSDGSKLAGVEIGDATVQNGSLVMPLSEEDFSGAALSPVVLSGHRQLTVHTKVKLDSANTWRHVFEMAMSNGTFITLYAHHDIFQLKSAYDNWNESYAWQINSPAFELDTWYDIVISFSGESISMYINGVLCGTVNGLYNNTVFWGCYYNSSELQVKLGCSSYWDAKNSFNGSMDYFRVYSKALTAEEVSTL